MSASCRNFEAVEQSPPLKAPLRARTSVPDSGGCKNLEDASPPQPWLVGKSGGVQASSAKIEMYIIKRTLQSGSKERESELLASDSEAANTGAQSSKSNKNKDRFCQHENIISALKTFVYFIPLVISAAILPWSTREFRYHDILLILNISLVTIHAIRTLAITPEDEKQLLAQPLGCSSKLKCFRKPAEAGEEDKEEKSKEKKQGEEEHQPIASSNLSMEQRLKSIKKIAWPPVSVVIHLFLYSLVFILGSHVPYVTSAALWSWAFIIAFFLLWFLIYKLRENVLKTFLWNQQRAEFVGRVQRRFLAWLTLQAFIIALYLSFWGYAHDLITPYFNYTEALSQNCTIANYYHDWYDGTDVQTGKGRSTEEKLIQLLRPKFLILLTVSGTCVLASCGVLFLWQTISEGTGTRRKYLNYSELSISHALQYACIVIIVGGCIACLFRAHFIMTSFLSFAHSTTAKMCVCRNCVDFAVLPSIRGTSLDGIHVATPTIDIVLITIVGSGLLILLMSLMYDFYCKRRKTMGGMAGMLENYRDVKGEKMRYHAFLSHTQGTGGNQTRLIWAELNRLGMNIWYDQRKQELDITTDGMVEGVKKSAVFVLFLSGTGDDCVLNRPYPRLEVITALKMKKPFVLVKEREDPKCRINSLVDWQLEDHTKLRKLVGRTDELLAENKLHDYGEYDTMEITDDESIIKEEKRFANAMLEIFRSHRATRFDRDIGKLGVMMEDIAAQVATEMKKTTTSSKIFIWPHGIIRPDDLSKVPDNRSDRSVSVATSSSNGKM